MNSYFVMNWYFKIHMQIVFNLRLHYVLRHLSLQNIYRLSSLIGKAICFLVPFLRKDITEALASCFPKLEINEIKQIADEHIIYLVFHRFLTSTLPFLSANKFRSFFDCDDLEKILEQRQYQGCMIAGTHFFPFLLIALLSDIFFMKDVKLCGSFGYDDAMQIPSYTAKIKERFHWNYHVPVTVNQSEQKDISSVRKLNCFLKKKEGSLLVFPDVRIKNSKSDISYIVGNGVLYASRGFNYCVDKMKNQDCVIPVHLHYRNGRFKVIVSDVMSPGLACTEYYGHLLPNLIREEPAQWQLWFMASVLMES